MPSIERHTSAAYVSVLGGETLLLISGTAPTACGRQR